MKGHIIAIWFVALAILVLVLKPCEAEEMVRGIVVDRNERTIWLGLPAPVQQGAVFNVMLLPGSVPIATAEVIRATPDYPYIAEARVTMLDTTASIPIGAYVEAGAFVIATGDELLALQRPWMTRERPRRLDLRVGALYPTESELRDETDDLWPAVELTYEITRTERADVNVGAGYYRRKGNFQVEAMPAQRDMWVLPITIDARVFLTNSQRTGWFWRFGSGTYIVRDKQTVGFTTETVTSTSVGWQTGVGFESRTGRSVQLNYVDGRKRNFRGLTLTVGARF